MDYLKQIEELNLMNIIYLSKINNLIGDIFELEEGIKENDILIENLSNIQED